MKSLQSKVAVVAGATRGAGRGIACALGEAGAIVYCTGRSKRSKDVVRKRKGWTVFETSTRPETIDETAEKVTSFGGKGIAVQVDHTDEKQVKILFERVKKQQGRLDILVNDVWGGDALTEWEKPFWQLSLEKGLQMLRQAVHSHIITSRYGVPLMVGRKQGLVVEITDGDLMYYRGTLFYDLVKTTVIRLAFDMAEELRKLKITALAVTPGFLRSEAMLEYFGVTEASWRGAAKKDPNFISSETPFFVGRAIAALAANKNVFRRTGKVLSSWGLAQEYGFTDIDGQRPNWGQFFAEQTDKRNQRIREEIQRSHESFLNAFNNERGRNV